MSALPTTGRIYQTSIDGQCLIVHMIKMKRRVEREMAKRNIVSLIPNRIHQLSDSIHVMAGRFQKRDFRHWEVEESYVREFGEWLIHKYAEVTGLSAKPWEYNGMPFAEEMMRDTRLVI